MTLPPTALSNVDGDSTYVRVQVLTNAGALDRDKQIAVVARLTGARRGGRRRPVPGRSDLGPPHGGPDGGWGLAGHANTNDELVAAARAQLAELKASTPPG